MSKVLVYSLTDVQWQLNEKANIYSDFTCEEDAYKAFKMTCENPNFRISYNFESLPKNVQAFVNFTTTKRKLTLKMRKKGWDLF